MLLAKHLFTIYSIATFFNGLGLIAMQQGGFQPNVTMLEEASEFPPIQFDNLSSLRILAQTEQIAPYYTYRELEVCFLCEF